ncbi:MAG: alpha/beta hydrolase [Terracidiphilus sp.]|jgi:pimeloyl-ACP methyl ester carboxylesterase
MKKILLCILALATLAGSPLFAQNIAGDWQNLDLSPGDSRVILKVAKADNGWSAQFFIIDIGPNGFPVSSITLQGGELRFAVDMIHGTYIGKLSADGNTISGTWNLGSSKPLNFTRATKETAWSTDPSPHTVKFITVDQDVKLEVLDWGGTGRPLILLTGLGDTAHVFDHFALKLTPSYHVYGITRRGFGASSAPVPTEDNYLADKLGDDVLAVIAALNLNRPILVGHSIAGEELSSIGSRHPEKVAGLIYLDAGHQYAFYNRSKNYLFSDVVDLRRKLGKLISGQGPREQKAVIEELLHSSLPEFEKTLKTSDEEIPEMPAGSADPPKAPEMPPIFKAITMGEQKYTEIKAPVLAIFVVPHDLSSYPMDAAARAKLEAMDLDVTTAQANAFEAGVPTARVVRLAHADHYIFRSNEADVLREIASFTATLPQ